LNCKPHSLNLLYPLVALTRSSVRVLCFCSVNKLSLASPFINRLIFWPLHTHTRTNCSDCSPTSFLADSKYIRVLISNAFARPKSSELLHLATATTASTLNLYRASPIDHLASRDPIRELPAFKMANTYEEARQSLPMMEPISRPSSTSTQNSTLHHSASLPQLPGLSALASLASTNNSPQLRYVGIWKRRGELA
jgi:hypothetical protein